MIEGYCQPKEIAVEEGISLVKYYPYYRCTLKWYQDPGLCKQVDGTAVPYDRERLGRMYRFLSSKGECYYIKVKEKGRWRLAGDISLWNGMISVVLCKESQNRHMGRKAVACLLGRAKEVGWRYVDAEVYEFNRQSRRMFLSVGFQPIEREKLRYELPG